MSRFIDFVGDALAFLGLSPDYWSTHRRRVQLSEYSDVIEELDCAGDCLVNALAYGSRGRHMLAKDDREALLELIDSVRNYIDHIKEEY